MTFSELSLWQFLLAAAGAFLAGMGKGGLPGVGNLTVAIFALTFAAKASVGLLLPILIVADMVAVLIYRKHADWRHILRLFPLTAIGVVVGWLVFGRISDRVVELIIGAVLIIFTGLHFLRLWLRKRRGEERAAVPQSAWFVILTGLSGGFATMIANAAGPVAALYLIAVGLPKYAFIGTSAWFFFLINLFKVPFHAQLGNIDFSSLGVSAALAPFAVLGALTSPHIIRRINQLWFGRLIWFFIVLAGVRLLWEAFL